MKALILVLVLVVVVPVVFRMVQRKLQDRDFKRQLDGKQPMRQGDECSRSTEKPFNAEMESEAISLRGRSMRDLGGH